MAPTASSGPNTAGGTPAPLPGPTKRMAPLSPYHNPFPLTAANVRASHRVSVLPAGPMPFLHSTAHDTAPAATDSVIAVSGDRLLARIMPDGSIGFPPISDVIDWPRWKEPALHVGRLDGLPCWLHAIDPTETEAPPAWAWQDVRALLGALTPSQWQAVGCARELHWWGSRHRFCGCCGAPTAPVSGERAMRCTACQALFFPVVSPAVIVAVTRGDRLLLGHNRNFRPGMFSLLAGFVEPGETLEQAAVREVREEVGIEIGNLRYICSQPWPFPNSLMAGFRADVLSGEITVDGHEIEQAAWFTRDSLPDIPRRGTVARELIDAWLAEDRR